MLLEALNIHVILRFEESSSNGLNATKIPAG
jgi:hypothetical protein